MSTIYDAPTSELTEAASREGFGSLERGMAGQYEFSIGTVIKEAWEKTSGSKLTMWSAFIAYFVVAMPISIGLPLVQEMLVPAPDPQLGAAAVSPAYVGSAVVTQLIIIMLTMPLAAGLFMVGVKVASDVPTSAGEVFSYFNKMFTLLGTTILIYIMIIIGTLLLVIPGIYLALAYYLTLPLIVEKGLGPWAAMEASRKAIGKSWFRMFGLTILLTIIVGISAIPLGIGLIWTLPLMMISLGIVYRNMFGLDAATAG